MKKCKIASCVVLILGALLLILNGWFWPLPDWVARMTGVLTIAAMFLLVFCSVRTRQER